MLCIYFQLNQIIFDFVILIILVICLKCNNLYESEILENKEILFI